MDGVATRFTQQLALQVIPRMRGHAASGTAKKIGKSGVELKQGIGMGLNIVNRKMIGAFQGFLQSIDRMRGSLGG